MRFIHLYLIGYFILVVGAGLALWQAGVLARMSGIWILISAIIVAIFDRMLFAAAEAGVANPAVSAAVAKPTVSTVVMARKIVRMTFSSEWRSQPFCDAIDNWAQSWRGVK